MCLMLYQHSNYHRFQKQLSDYTVNILNRLKWRKTTNFKCFLKIFCKIMFTQIQWLQMWWHNDCWLKLLQLVMCLLLWFGLAMEIHMVSNQFHQSFVVFDLVLHIYNFYMFAYSMNFQIKNRKNSTTMNELHHLIDLRKINQSEWFQFTRKFSTSCSVLFSADIVNKPIL